MAAVSLVPMWGTICVGITALVILLCCCGCLIRLCWRRSRGRGLKKGLKGAVDLKSVQLLGDAIKEKVGLRLLSLSDSDTCIQVIA